MNKIVDHWENAHKQNDQYWLTGSKPEHVYAMHHIKDLAQSNGLSVMEIGVGFGDSIKNLAQRHNVTAIDISTYALEKVSSYSTTVLTPNMSSINGFFDLILCHLVLQHCDRDMVTYIIHQSLRLLNRTGGLFSFQFAYLPDINKADDALINSMRCGLHNFYSLDDIKSIVISGGGKIAGIFGPMVFPDECGINWYIMHCVV